MELIIERVSCGRTLVGTCRQLKAEITDGRKVPTESDVRLWVMNDTPPGLTARYARARMLQMEAWADDIIQVAEDGSRDVQYVKRVKDDATGKMIELVMEAKEFTNRSRLIIDAKKWIMSKLHPEKWGERIGIEARGVMPGVEPKVVVNLFNGTVPSANGNGNGHVTLNPAIHRRAAAPAGAPTVDLTAKTTEEAN